MSFRRTGGNPFGQGETAPLQRAVLTEFLYDNQAALYRLAFAYVHSREAALDVVQDTVVNAMTHLCLLYTSRCV